MKRGPLNIELRKIVKNIMWGGIEGGGCGGSTQQSETNRPHSRAPSSHVLVEMHESIYHDLNTSPAAYNTQRWLAGKTDKRELNIPNNTLSYGHPENRPAYMFP